MKPDLNNHWLAFTANRSIKGQAFASQSFEVIPDILTMAKALTNGTMPMGAVAASREIYQTMTQSAAPNAIQFFHGYTWSAHPAATAAALTTLKYFHEEQLFRRCARLANRSRIWSFA